MLGEPVEARKEALWILRQSPSSSEALLTLAESVRTEQELKEVEQQIQQIKVPESSALHWILGNLALRQNDAPTAEKELQYAFDLSPHSNVPGIKYYLAHAYVQNDDPKQAIAELNKAVAAKPDYVEAVLLLAQLNLRASNFQPVVAAMTDLLKKRPDMPAAQTLLAEAYRLMGRLDEAATVVREQIKASPQNAEAYFLLGVILRQQNKAAEAREAFQKTLELAPDNLLPIDQLVELDVASKNFESAMGRVQVALQKVPNSAPLRLIEAKVYVAQQAWDQAEASLRKALELDPNLQSAYELLISTYIAINRLPQAINELQAYVSKWPDDPRARMTLGEIYEKQKDPLKARNAYEKILAKNPEFVPALNNLAYLYADKLNEIDKAYDLAQKARGLRSEPATTDTLGWVLYKKGDYRQGLALFQESAGKLAQNPDAP